MTSAAKIGVYVCIHPDSQRLFGEQTQLLADLAKMAEDYETEFVVLGPGFSATGRGFRYQDEDWISVATSMPDVILRRSGAFSAKDEQQVRTDMKAFSLAGKLYTLPRSFSNKWRFHQVISTDSNTVPYLLKTNLATSAKDVYRIVRQWSDVYAKPLTGSQGHHVLRITRTSSGCKAQWQRTVKGSRKAIVVQRQMRNYSEFEDFWRKYGMRRCVVQETFSLPLAGKEAPFDFRWLVQYMDKKTPKVTARIGRLGSERSITTNLHTGATPEFAESLLSRLGWSAADDLVRRLDEVALQVAEVCRRNYGPIAEVGVDLAAHENGDIRIFEINPTPGRRMLRLLSPELRELSLRYLLEYAITATGSAGKS